MVNSWSWELSKCAYIWFKWLCNNSNVILFPWFKSKYSWAWEIWSFEILKGSFSVFLIFSIFFILCFSSIIINLHCSIEMPNTAQILFSDHPSLLHFRTEVLICSQIFSKMQLYLKLKFLCYWLWHIKCWNIVLINSQNFIAFQVSNISLFN